MCKIKNVSFKGNEFLPIGSHLYGMVSILANRPRDPAGFSLTFDSHR